MPWQPHWVARIQDPYDNITDNNCSNGVQWIYHVLNDCVWNGRGIASEVFGLVSIVTWMLVSIPQMWKNFRHIQGVEGISLLLILMWTLGDTANLVGGILTKQLPLQQYGKKYDRHDKKMDLRDMANSVGLDHGITSGFTIYLAIYFVFADLVLFAQFLYYNLWWRRRYKGYEPISPSSHSPSINSPPPQVVLCIAGALMFSVHGSARLFSGWLEGIKSPQFTVAHHPAGRTLLAHNLGYHIEIFNNIEDEVGYAIGVVSSVFYTFSRVGQMWKNYKRKSTEGLSILMFILAVFGNLTYGLSILVRQLDAKYIIRHLPWLVGSLGVIFLDTSLLVQFRYYGNKDQDTVVSEEVAKVDKEITVTVHRPRTASIS